MDGFYNRLLRVDLTRRTSAVEPIPDEVAARYLGGKGLGAYLLVTYAPPGVDPLAPENPFIIATGPATDSGLAPASRHVIVAKSPLTGIFGESYAGGHTAPRIRATGYDAVMLEGAAAEPICLEISDAGVRFHDAAHLWGRETYGTEDALKAEVGVRGPKAIVIGPAGEELVPFAVVNNDYWRQAGRTGMGAVLGSKKVKGIVFHGSARCQLHDREAIEVFDKDLRAQYTDSAAARLYRTIGTPRGVALANRAGAFPSYYWSKGSVPYWEQISGEALAERFKPKPRACFRCFLACGKLTTVTEGPYAGTKVEGPEHETIYAFGGVCAVDDLAAIAYLNDLCDRLGLDTISAGNAVGLAIEASRRGKVDFRLDYGDVAGISTLVREIGSRTGRGELFSQGVRAASQELGLEEIAVHVKGLEPAGYDPRALKGMGLAYAVSERGGCHLRATVYMAEFTGGADPQAIEGKAELVLDFEDRHTLFDTLILCRFYRDMIGWNELPVVIHGLTGLKLDQVGLQEMSADIANLIRGYNLREGLTPDDDTLPARLLHEPLEPDGQTLTQAELQRMVADYYALRGWA